MYKYKIIINWSKIDELFIAEAPELPGCIAHGDTQEIALANIKEAIELWIDTAKEFGDFIPEPQELQNCCLKIIFSEK
ncbi:MAG: type II toxin-antitoxin system HicB family antitoxin [Xenococcaceae cyanobacterium]